MLSVDWNLLFTIVNLLILFVLLKIFLFKPVQKIIAKRQEEIDQEFDKANEAAGKADELKKQYEESMATVEDEKKQAVIDARKKANEEYDRILSEAKAHADSIVENAKADAETEKGKILSKAEAEITDMVINATAKVVGARIDANQDKALYDQFLSQVGSLKES